MTTGDLVDGLHPGDAGNVKIADALQPLIAARL
jgi:lysophospholipase L1-like esterase